MAASDSPAATLKRNATHFLRWITCDGTARLGDYKVHVELIGANRRARYNRTLKPIHGKSFLARLATLTDGTCRAFLVSSGGTKGCELWVF
jgi:hypothetical protein